MVSCCAMGIQDIRKLWGRAGGRCSICDRDLTDGGAEKAHMVARRLKGARGDAPLPPNQRDRYENLILLCPNCHTRVDQVEPELWPVERLEKAKAAHEERIRSAGQQVSELAGTITVTVVGADDAAGVRIKKPTRIKPGTVISVEATDVRQVTGVEIGGNDE